MKERFRKDLGIDVDDSLLELMEEFNVNGLLDQESDDNKDDKDEKIGKEKK